MNAMELLAQVDLFRHLKPDTTQAVLRAAGKRALTAGEVLFREGDRGEFLFVVVSGALDAFTHRAETGKMSEPSATSAAAGQSPNAGASHDGEPKDACLLRRLGRGDVGGLTSIILKQPRSATLIAACPSELLVLTQTTVEQLLDEHPDFSRSLIAMLSEKVRGKTRALTSLIQPINSDRFRIAFYDTKPYDRASFEPGLGDDLHVDWLSPRLDARSSTTTYRARPSHA